MNSRGFHGSFLRKQKGELGQNRDCTEQYEDQNMGVDAWPGCQGLLVVNSLKQIMGIMRVFLVD